MTVQFGEVFDDARGHPKTLIYNFKSNSFGGGRYLMAFTVRADLVVLRQHTTTPGGLIEVTVGFTTEQLQELQSLLPELIEESKLGRTSEQRVEQLQNEQRKSSNPFARKLRSILDGSK